MTSAAAIDYRSSIDVAVALYGDQMRSTTPATQKRSREHTLSQHNATRDRIAAASDTMVFVTCHAGSDSCVRLWNRRCRVRRNIGKQ